jgi:SWIB/MDM2 domain
MLLQVVQCLAYDHAAHTISAASRRFKCFPAAQQCTSLQTLLLLAATAKAIRQRTLSLLAEPFLAYSTANCTQNRLLQGSAVRYGCGSERRTDVLAAVQAYIAQQKLIDPRNPTQINFDQRLKVLSTCCGSATALK